jgi:hypothetical protein
MSVGHSSAFGGNGNAVSGGSERSEGLRERSLRESAGRGSPAVDANCAHAFVAVFAMRDTRA